MMNIYSNLTSLEELKGVIVAKKSVEIEFRLPFCGDMGKNKAPNQYDVLWPNNLITILGPTIFSWFVPFYIPPMKGRGLYYPKIPKVQPEEVADFQKCGDSNKVVKKPKLSVYNYKEDFEQSCAEYVLKAHKKY
jgi:hypothetical protein